MYTGVFGVRAMPVSSMANTWRPVDAGALGAGIACQFRGPWQAVAGSPSPRFRTRKSLPLCSQDLRLRELRRDDRASSSPKFENPNLMRSVQALGIFAGQTQLGTKGFQLDLEGLPGQSHLEFMDAPHHYCHPEERSDEGFAVAFLPTFRRTTQVSSDSTIHVPFPASCKVAFS